MFLKVIIHFENKSEEEKNEKLASSSYWILVISNSKFSLFFCKQVAWMPFKKHNMLTETK